MPPILSSVSTDLKNFLDQITPGFNFEEIIKWMLIDEAKGELRPYVIIFIILFIAIILFLVARLYIVRRIKKEKEKVKKFLEQHK